MVAADGLEEALASNDFAKAELLLEELAEAWETKIGSRRDPADIREYGLTLQALGTIERQGGKQDEALDHLTTAKELLSNAEPSIRADVSEALALTAQDLGRLEEAESLLREVIALRRSMTVTGALGQSLDHLALNLLAQGKYPEAGKLLKANLEAAPPDNPQLLARRMGHFGRYLHTLGSHSRAAGIFRQALDLPFEDPELRLSLGSQLALARLRLGDSDEARRGMEAAADEARQLYRDSGRLFLAAPYLINLGALDLMLGDPQQAQVSFAGALELLEQSLPSDHPSLIVPLNNLGCAEQAAGNLAEAEKHLSHAARLQRLHLPRLHLRVAETARNLARNALLRGDPSANPEVERATGLGIELLNELIHQGTEQERLNFLQRLDLISLPCATGDPERIADTLIATKARLLDTMLSPDEANAGEAPTWREIQASLPKKSAFIDTCRYTTIGDEPEERFGAILLLPAGPPKWIPLGSVADLQRWLGVFRERLAWRAGQLSGNPGAPPALKLRAILRSLDREFWEPVARELPGGTGDIAFSPDGALHFLPLPALLDPEMRPLCERHRQVTTVASARDLLGKPAAIRLADTPWTVLGISQFPKSKLPPSDDPLLGLLASLDAMPGTADESRRIQSIAPRGSTFLRNEEATELALHSLDEPSGVLHLGCHAFFLSSDSQPGTVIDFDENADLLYSGGLLLHGAALRGPDSSLTDPADDLLFPSEVARLPLRDTRLITLSSCESGAGTVVSGEGLLGLRRGFALAGAREIVVALWPVSDRSTPEFMERFYRLALASERPAQALWQCQREFLAGADSDDEFEAAVLRYGPFILSQNTPLSASGAEINPPEASPTWWWKLLVALPAILFVVGRLGMKRKEPAP